MNNFFIIGNGSWASSFGNYLANIGKSVTIYGRNSENIDEISKTRINEKYLPGFKLNESIKWTSSLDGLNDSNTVVLAISSQAISKFLDANKGVLDSKDVIILSKGIDIQSKKVLSDVVAEKTNSASISVISGPSHAEEVIKDMPTAVVVAGENEEVIKRIQSEISSKTLRLYRSKDIVGVELSGALKNIVAIAVGIADGLGFGDNTKAAIMTRGMNEIIKFAKSFGAKDTTFLGLSGFGDLIVTCTSMHSRNRRFGNLVGEGYSVEDAIKKVGMVVEGYYTLKVTHDIARDRKIDTPLFSILYNILYESDYKDIKEVVSKLMLREYKEE